MKKVIAIYTILATICWIVSPAFVGAIDTGLTKDSGSGANPIVKASWEMYPSATQGLNGRDDSTDPASQFKASGIYDSDKTIQVCSIVTDTDGMTDINNVYADIYYPTGISGKPVHPTWGCGNPHGNEFLLSQLLKADGITLVCNELQNSTTNSNLITWETGYSYTEVCNPDGELMKGTAYVYCGSAVLDYEDPSGDYRTLVLAQDKSGKNGTNGTSGHPFTYLATTAYEVDFNKISYGAVKLGTTKTINGNLAWDSVGTNNATVRNVGNTRLAMTVQQNDMGLGMTGSDYNVSYGARLGNDAAFAPYAPNAAAKQLLAELDLSSSNEMDFTINVSKFPVTGSDTFTGTMTLGAVYVDHLLSPCEN
ncbi:MAG: hypothetical protein WC242_05340 [Candidatus Paceibacterota bacterium]|jgi:hypothetical protein